MPHYLIVDGGGTKTAASLYRLEGGKFELLFQNRGQASNPHACGLERAFDHLEDLFRDIPDVGVPFDILAGIAGCGNPEYHAPLHAWFIRRFPGANISLMSDAELLLDCATPLESRFVLIAGTGSVCMARDCHGHFCRVGGWGPLLGDEGGAVWLGLRGIQAAIRANDRRDSPTTLVDAIPRFANAHSLRELAGWILKPPIDSGLIASFARVVLAEAQAGDAVSIRLVNAAAQELESLANAMMMSLKRRDVARREPYAIALVGSLIVHSKLIKREFERRLALSHPGTKTWMIEDVPAEVIRQCSFRGEN